MDRSHSRSASPREPARPQHRPPSPPSPPAFENRAYQHDESDPNHNDSFTSNGPQQNGHSKEPNGDTKTLEAVNLELINLTPKNGSTKQKKDVEVDMNASNPYDEYFVPVNEHRKYMRGEKLYVTADKRGEKGGCKRPLCWTLLGLVVVAIVALIVLAATGILFTNSPTPLQPYNTSVSSARALGGITHRTSNDQDHDNDHEHDHDNEHNHDHEHDHDHDRDHDHDHDHDHGHEHHHSHDHEQTTESMQTTVHEQITENVNNLEPESSHEDNSHDNESQEHTHDHDQTTASSTVPQHGPQMQNDQAHSHSVASEETSDNSMYVPRTLEGELKIDNEEFSEALENPESDEYSEFVATFSDGLKRALMDTLQSGDNDIALEVVKIRSGSIIVTYRIHWNPRYNAQSSDNLLTTSSLEASLNSYLAQNNRMIGIYHIAEDNIATRPVLDMCQINKNDCEYGCEFNKRTLDFMCTCPHGQILDMKQPKKCMLLLENSEQTGSTSHVGIISSNTITPNPISEEENPITETVHILEQEIGQNKFDWKQTDHRTSETTTENDVDLNFSHIFGNPSDQNEERTKEVSIPPPQSSEEEDTMPTLDVNFSQSTTSKPKSEVTTISELSLSSTTHESTAEPVAEPEPTSEPQAEPKSTTNILKQNTLNQENSQEEADEVEPNPEPEPATLPKIIPVTTTTAEPQPTPEPQPTTEPILLPTTETESQSDLVNMMSSEPEKTTNSLGIDHTDSLTTDQPSVIMTESKYDSQPNYNNADQFEITTMKISLAEPHNESKLETIFSLNANKHLEESNNDKTTTENDWLENITEISQIYISEPTTQDNSALLDNSMENLNTRATDQRSSKAFDNEFLTEETTRQATTMTHTDKEIQKTNTTHEDFVFEQITKKYELPINKTTIMENMEDSTDPTTTAVSISQIFAGKKYADNGSLDTTTVAVLTGIEETRQIFNTGSMENYTYEENMEHKSQTSLFEGVSVNSSKSENTGVTMPAFEITTEYSIAKQNKDSNIDQSLMSALKETNITGLDEVKTENNVSTEKDFPEGDITFDAINKLFNRSSKSFMNDSVNVEGVSETTDEFKETAETTTSSDWLSETVTEINYQEAINKNKNLETTDAPVTKIDYIMGRGLNKDDFEPDYLNMGSNTSKNLEHDEPLYGMLHDYDNEESSIKRVKNEQSVIIDENVTADTTTRDNKTEGNVTISFYNQSTTEMDKQFETTTMIEYIYKTAMNESHGSSSDRQVVPPVWENSEDDMNFTVKELSKQFMENTMPESNISSTRAPTFITAELQNINNQDTINTSVQTDNTTQGNNLNVTIYEISSKNNNHSVEKSVNHQSAEYDDHETEMNPFLPEIENNKSLVKKLQEGHDLEPSNMNETQNENIEEQPHNASEGNMISDDQARHLSKGSNVSSIGQENTHTKTVEDDALSNELTMHQKTFSSEDELLSDDMIKDTETTPSSFDDDSKESSGQKDSLPFSTFLLDTDDLDTTKELLDDERVKSGISQVETTMLPMTLSETTTDTKTKIVDENQFLNVVPIEQENLTTKENLKNTYERENNQEFNLISDSPKKSDRRTVESSNINSSTNNEA